MLIKNLNSSMCLIPSRSPQKLPDFDTFFYFFEELKIFLREISDLILSKIQISFASPYHFWSVKIFHYRSRKEEEKYEL